MTVRVNIVLEAVTSGLIQIMYMNTADMVADVLTKPLQGILFYEMISRLLGTVVYKP